MMRKLVVTGWVLMIQDAEQARVLVALLVSVAFLSLHLFIKPLERDEDGILTAFIQVAMVLICNRSGARTHNLRIVRLR
jgi:hypothetical protein